MTRKGYFYVAIIAVLFVLWYIQRVQHDAQTDAQIVSRNLPPNVEKKIIVDTKAHQIVIVEKGKGRHGEPIVEQRIDYLPPQAAVEIDKAGNVTVVARAYGTEHWPFVGFVFDTEGSGRANVGLNLFYWRRIDIGAGLSFGMVGARDARAFLSCGYNIYSNTSFYVGVDNHKAVSVGIALKF